MFPFRPIWFFLLILHPLSQSLLPSCHPPHLPGLIHISVFPPAFSSLTSNWCGTSPLWPLSLALWLSTQSGRDWVMDEVAGPWRHHQECWLGLSWELPISELLLLVLKACPECLKENPQANFPRSRVNYASLGRRTNNYIPYCPTHCNPICLISVNYA